MNTFRTTLAALAVCAATPALADGDAAAGEKEFGKCKACHSIVAADGSTIVKGGRTGPNLFGVIGRAAGTEDFRYSPSMAAAGAAGLVWDRENLAQYSKDPTAFLKDVLGDSKAKSTMTFKLRKGGEDVAAYLASLGG